MKLENIVPFGRSLDEYSRMFRLTREDRSRNVLGVADGPASFNAEWTAQGGSVVSVDPIYAFEAGEIRNRFDAVVDDIIEQVVNTPGNWVWSYHEKTAKGRKRNAGGAGVMPGGPGNWGPGGTGAGGTGAGGCGGAFLSPIIESDATARVESASRAGLAGISFVRSRVFGSRRSLVSMKTRQAGTEAGSLASKDPACKPP